MVHKLTFENRLIRFLLFDLLLGFELADVQFPAWVLNLSGGIAIYLLLTVVSGYCIFHSSYVWWKNKRRLPLI